MLRSCRVAGSRQLSVFAAVMDDIRNLLTLAVAKLTARRWRSHWFVIADNRLDTYEKRKLESFLFVHRLTKAMTT